MPVPYNICGLCGKMDNAVMRQRRRNRLIEYNYSIPGAYFVTICVQNAQPLFGEIITGEMKLNEYGKIAVECWRDLPRHYPNCKLDEFIVMPNHVHGIIFIIDSGVAGNGFKPFPCPCREQACLFPTRNTCSQRHQGCLNRQHQKLPIIIGSFKSAGSKLIHQSGHLHFQWQKSYYDRIIRTDDELNRIRQYIRANPTRAELSAQ